MNNEEIIEFMKHVLISVENAELLLRHEPPRHIPAYHKILGIQQKFERLNANEQKVFFAQMVGVRGVVAYFLNGRYDEGIQSLIKIKTDFISISHKAHENIKNSTI